ncbi:MAG: hypothetical protein GC136_11265 [Alphaproteobacteria bacterium]|nr:hypothetical protein [Alphaproteobacteria bacterium]
MDKKIMAALLLFVVALPINTSAHASVFGGSNLSFTGYPSPQCRKPYKPYEFTSQFDVDTYNDEVERYVRCIKEYIDNASNDIDRIKEAVNTAVNEANSR